MMTFTVVMGTLTSSVASDVRALASSVASDVLVTPSTGAGQQRLLDVRVSTTLEAAECQGAVKTLKKVVDCQSYYSI